MKGSRYRKIFRLSSISINNYTATETELGGGGHGHGHKDRREAKSSKKTFFPSHKCSSAFLLISVLSWIASAAVANFCQISCANFTQFLVYQNHIHLSWSFTGTGSEWKTWARTLECGWDIICLCMCVYSFLNIIIYTLWKQGKKKKRGCNIG